MQRFKRFILLLVATGMIFLFGCNFTGYKYTVNPQGLCFENAVYNPANDMQYGAYTHLGVSEGKLYFWPSGLIHFVNRTRFDRNICVFTPDGAERLSRLDYGLQSIRNGFAYYCQEGADYTWSFCSLNLETGEKKLLLENLKTSLDFYYQEDTLYYSGNSDSSAFYPILEGCVLPLRSGLQMFRLSQGQYFLNDCWIDENAQIVFRHDGVDSVLEEIPMGTKSLIPTQAGLLVHAAGHGELLYLIPDGENTVIELFSDPCFLSDSAVNVHGDYAYLSVKRYYFDLERDGSRPIDDDPSTGTFRINLKNYSCEKLSDSTYNGLFIFDDSGIYATDDQGRILFLDFEGKMLQALLG